MEKSEEKCPTDIGKWTMLHSAAFGGQLNTCKYLVENFGRVTARSGNGSTPLHIAARYGNLEVCKYFLEIVQDKEPITILGETPLVAAAKNQHHDVCILISSYMLTRGGGRSSILGAQIQNLLTNH